MPLKKKTKPTVPPVTPQTKVKKKTISKVAKDNSKELVIKTKPQWVKNSLATKKK